MKAFQFKPLLKTTLWGGEELKAMKQLADAPRQVGESWEISGLPGHETPVAAGEFRGNTLQQLAERFGAAFMGEHNVQRYGTQFPLLVKFISTAKDLSIQVHPDDGIAQRMGHPFGINEMWYIIQAQPGAFLYLGFERRLTPQSFSEALMQGSLQSFLRQMQTKPGDAFFIPAGCIHSIGAGNLLIEIQQSSNDTFRVYDFDRRDADGNKRELHVEQAREALCFDPDTAAGALAYAADAQGTVTLLDCPQFRVRLLRQDGPGRLDYARLDSFAILVAFEGEALLRYDEGDLCLRAGESALFPASATFVEVVPGPQGFKALEASCP